ncbi:MAG: phosphate acetyltransferase [Myxococcota bacterium]|jgi:phosphate acetyltransferase|nr:phosphate acetyltransferase [Myxococcota bacterium]
MAQTLMVVATQPGTGKSVVSLALLELFEQHGAIAHYYKPVTLGSPDADPDLSFVRKARGISTPIDPSCSLARPDVEKALQDGKLEDVMDHIMDTHARLASERDIIVCEGVDSLSSFPTLDSDINIDIARNIDATLLLVANARNRKLDDIVQGIILARNEFVERGTEMLGVVVNRVNAPDVAAFEQGLRAALGEAKIAVYGVLPELSTLSRPRMCDIVRELNASIVQSAGCPELAFCQADAGKACSGPIGEVLVVAMALDNAIRHFTHRALIITAGDRDEIALAAAAAYASETLPKPAGLVLTGGLMPQDKVMGLVKDLGRELPILQVNANTYETAIAVNSIHPSLIQNQEDKARAVRSELVEHLDKQSLLAKRFAPQTPVVTPRRFMRMLRDKAKGKKMTIVLPEGDVDRMLIASAELRKHDIVDIIVIGNEEKLSREARQLGIEIGNGFEIVDPATDPVFEDYAQTLFELRKNKGVDINAARALMKDRNFYGTMMVYKGRAHGMVSGSTTTTADTIRPALQFVKTAPGISNVSSIFFMALPDKVLVYGDCAVITNPTPEQLADIACASAATAAAFGIEPRVAMLSYSTGASGKGEDVDLVRQATDIVKSRNLDFPVEGPIQYDAATEPSVAKTKLPNSLVAGRATVYIFPDLNTGNNTYKAVQRSANAVAIGPVLQGLRKPINDLSRGATVTDIVNTVIVTAIQAQAMV